MISNALDLLRLLGSQATPGVAPNTGAAPNAASGKLDFAKLLSGAKAGRLSSGREVTIAKGAGVSLSDDQLKRLAAAADIAESQGATRALVMIDGMAIRLDVSMREVTGAVDLNSQGVMTGIDSVIHVPAEGGTQGAAPMPAPLARALDNPSLLNLLARRAGSQAA